MRHHLADLDDVLSHAEPVQRPVIYTIRGRPGPLDRPALPSGHPESWGVITAGTVLDQAKYPWPIFTP